MTDKKTPEITLLSWKQVTGKRRIKAIERLETKCAATDFAICLGSFIYKDVHVDYDSSLKGRTGSW